MTIRPCIQLTLWRGYLPAPLPTTLLFQRRAVLLEEVPDLWRGHGDIDAAHTQMPHRVHHRVDDGRWRANRWRFADALRADRVVRRRRNRLADFPFGRFNGGRDHVVHERAAVDV